MFAPVSGAKTRLALAGAAVIVVVILAGCGRKSQPDLVKGKTLFAQKCASCHTLARANAKGQVGPNLDDAFAQARRDGFGKQTFEGVVYEQIANVRRSSQMPPDLVKGQSARDVAGYIAAVAGVGGKDQGALANAGQTKASSKPIVASGSNIRIDADPTGALAFASSQAKAKAGRLSFTMVNKASVPHDIAVETRTGSKALGGKLLGKGSVVSNGKTSTFTATLKKGTYTFLCTVPGHAEGGMLGKLVVQ